MQKLVETRIEVDERITAGERLPGKMVLYAIDADHFVITAKPLKTLGKSALTRAHVEVTSQQNKYVIRLPPKIYNFYHLDENDYTVMVSNKDPTTIVIAI
jgi:hypothetical protein